MALGCPGSRDPALPSVQRACVCVCVCVCMYQSNTQRFTLHVCIYVQSMFVWMFVHVCENMCTCRYVLLLPGFPGALEVPRGPLIHGLPSWSEVLGDPRLPWDPGSLLLHGVGTWDICGGIPRSIPGSFISCVCAHTHIHSPYTYTHFYKYTTHLPSVSYWMFLHHDHTHQLGRVQAHGYLHTVGSQPPQSMRSSCIT